MFFSKKLAFVKKKHYLCSPKGCKAPDEICFLKEDNPNQSKDNPKSRRAIVRALQVKNLMINIQHLKDEAFDIVGAIYEVRNVLGPGLNEYVYQEALSIELETWQIPFQREPEFHPIYRGREMEALYRLDFLCADKVIIECKAVERLVANHRAQLFNYMRLTGIPMGILVNFSPRQMELERYYYDVEKLAILGSDGEEVCHLNKY